MKSWMLYIMNGLKLPTAKESNIVMNSLVNHIKASVPTSSIATKIVENECEARVTLTQNNIIINLNDGKLLDKLSRSSDEKKADFIFANDAEGTERPWNKSRVVVIELKGGKSSLSINPIVEQIKAGAQIAEQLIPDTYKVVFHPILVYTQTEDENAGTNNKRIHPGDRKRLKKQPITFHDKKAYIKTLKSGEHLSKAL